jgi:hypothetical protein
MIENSALCRARPFQGGEHEARLILQAGPGLGLLLT